MKMRNQFSRNNVNMQRSLGDSQNGSHALSIMTPGFHHSSGAAMSLVASSVNS